MLNCAANIADAMDQFIETSHNQIREWCKIHKPEVSVGPDGLGGLCGKLEFKF
jgi:RNA processing factor Prp31